MEKKAAAALTLMMTAALCLAFLLHTQPADWTVSVGEGIGFNEGGSGVTYRNIVRIYLNGRPLQAAYNSMTVDGRTAINQRLFTAASTAPFNYIAIGTGTDDGNNTNNSALVSELTRAQAEYYVPAAGQWGLNCTFTFSGSYTIKEAGIFNASSGGALAFYIGNLSIPVTSADTLKISWTGTTSGST